jgi:hypothetical protein
MICRRSATGDGAGKGECRENAPQDSRARLAGRAGRVRIRGSKFEVFGVSNPELRTSHRAFLACRALHALRPLALVDFFSLLLVMEGL